MISNVNILQTEFHFLNNAQNKQALKESRTTCLKILLRKLLFHIMCFYTHLNYLKKEPSEMTVISNQDFDKMFLDF